jgi:glycosyltransferase 2 family protein
MTTSSKHSRLGQYVNYGLVALAIGLFVWMIWLKWADIRVVFSGPLDLRLLFLAIAIFVVGLCITFVRWFVLVRVIEPTFTLRATMVLGFIGSVYNLVIPGAVGGDLIKAAYLIRMRIKKTQAVASMVIDRILGLLGLFVLASIAGAISWGSAPPAVQNLIIAAWAATGMGLIVLVAIFAQVFTRLFPQLKRQHSRVGMIVSELHEMSATYRGRLGVVIGCGVTAMVNHSLNVLAFFLVDWMLFPTMTTTLAQHFLVVPLTLFSMAVPIPFGALGFSEGVSDQLFKLVGHNGGILGMMGFRVVMYGGGLVGACVYLANLKEVRGLTATAHKLEDELLEGELDEDQDNATGPV